MFFWFPCVENVYHIYRIIKCSYKELTIIYPKRQSEQII